jgi:Holliday junction resolvase
MRIPKRMKPFGNSKAQDRSRHQEKEVAKRIGGRQVRGSGSGTEKGDARKRGIVRIECKTTERRSFSVNLAMLNKLETAADISGELPVLVIEFLKDGKPWRSVCITTDSLLDRIKELE